MGSCGASLEGEGLEVHADGGAWSAAGVSVARRRTPWRDADKSLGITETFLVLRGADPRAFVATKRGVEFLGGNTPHKVGDHVYVRLVDPPQVAAGVVRFVGTPNEPGVVPTSVGSASGHVEEGASAFDGRTLWVGVELARPCGAHDGRVRHARYFTARPGHGVFAPPHRVSAASRGRERAYDGCPLEVCSSPPHVAMCMAHAPIRLCGGSDVQGPWAVYRYAVWLHAASRQTVLSATQWNLCKVMRKDVKYLHPRVTREYLEWWHRNEDPKVKLAEVIAALLRGDAAGPVDGTDGGVGPTDDELFAQLDAEREAEASGAAGPPPATTHSARTHPDMAAVVSQLDAQDRILAQLLAEQHAVRPAVGHSATVGRSRTRP